MTKNKELSKRQKMVKGTRFVFTKNTNLSQIDNSGWQATFRRSHMATAEKDDVFIVSKNKFTLSLEDKAPTPKGGVGNADLKSTFLVSVKHISSKKEFDFIWDEIEDNIDLLTVPEISLYYVRNKETKEYYKSQDFHVYFLEWTNKLTEAKKWKDLSPVRNFILGVTGYYTDLNVDYETAHVNWKKAVEPEIAKNSWEIVKIDKTTKEITEVIEIKDYLEKTYRLKPITKKYGSSVRGLFKKLEDDNILDNFCTLMVFISKYGEIQNEEIEKVNEAVKILGSCKRNKDTRSIAIALETESEDVVLNLVYKGNMDKTVINLKELKEIL